MIQKIKDRIRTIFLHQHLYKMKKQIGELMKIAEKELGVKFGSSPYIPIAETPPLYPKSLNEHRLN